MHLSARLEQLVLQPFDAGKDAARTIPCEDIGVLLIDEPQCTITQGAIESLLKHGATVIVCGRDHLPAGMMLPTCTHNEQVTRLHEQINASKPSQKKLWQQIIRTKIINQSTSYPKDSDARGKLQRLAKDVRSGDTTNIEGQAGRVHWAAWRAAHPKLKHFRRNPDGDDIANSLLNYGYAAVRAAVARSIVSTGLHTALGVHHHNRANAFCLADDLMEPLRPAVDRRVRQMLLTGVEVINSEAKAELIPVLTDTVTLGDTIGPMMVALPRMTASLVRYYRKEVDQVLLPVLPEADE